jgi:FAD/FMN-containing dehydrogenase
MMPIDLGAKGSCHIGGNLATNAGGIKFIKYNSMHANCIGLTAVLPDGSILKDMKGLRKDNTGYDWKHLFIGSEGTLGIITECAILCPVKPKFSTVAMIGVNQYEDVVDLNQKIKSGLGDLTAIEYYDRVSMKFVNDHLKLDSPFDKSYNYNMLIEVGSNDEDSNRASLESVFEKWGEKIEDGVIS